MFILRGEVFHMNKGRLESLGELQIAFAVSQETLAECKRALNDHAPGKSIVTVAYLAVGMG